jgi:hypothetical protein
MKTFRVILLILVILLCIIQHENSLSGSRKKDNYSKEIFISEEIQNKMQSGDVILRNGKGFISDVFRQFSLKDKSYSHAGIVSIEQKKVYVYHILGGEESNEKSLRKELLASFCNFSQNDAVAVYRYDLSPHIKDNIIGKLQSLSRKKITFDSHFDLKTDSAMYCTELIYKVVTVASGNNKYFPTTFIDGNEYIAPDNLYLNGHASLIFTSNNK